MRNWCLVFLMLFYALSLSGLCGEVSWEKSRIANNVTLQFYPVKAGKKGEKGCQLYYGDCLMFLTEKPVMEISNFRYEIFEGEKPGLNIFLSARDRANTRKMSESYLNGRVAMVYRGRILHAPKIRTVIDTDRSQLTFCNRRNFQVVRNSLEGKIVDDEVFRRGYDCDCSR